MDIASSSCTTDQDQGSVHQRASQASGGDIAMERGKAKEESPGIQEVSDNQPKRNDTNNSKDEISITILEKKEQIEPLHRLPPSMLKRIYLEPKDFEPMVVSLGPYYHGKEHLQVTLADKCKAKDQLLRDKIAENLCKEEPRISMEAARKLYADDPKVLNFSIDDLILDACFIIHVMDYIVNEKKSGLAIRPHLLPWVVEDMFLLENQVPFKALECTMNYLEIIDPKEMITAFVSRITESPTAAFESNRGRGLGCLPLEHPRPPYEQRVHNNFLSFWEEGKPFHLLQILRAHLLGYSEEREPAPQPYLSHPPRCATELEKAGISFESRRTYSLEDAKFVKGIIFGQLSLPSITQLTKRRMVNLIAYELCSSGAGYGITSYIHFLDGLIDRPEDVKELRSKNILPKGLGSDEDVANFFNMVRADLAPDPSVYYHVLKDIETHCSSKMRYDFAGFCYKHFFSPCTTISFLIAVLLFLIGIAQAYNSFFGRKT